MELDLLAADPHEAFAEARARDPVHWSARHRGWILTRYDDVVAAFRDPRLSADRASRMAQGTDGVDPVVSVLSRWMVFTDPPDHTRMRRALRPAFTPPAIAALRPTVERVVDELLADLRGDVDFVQRFAIPLPAIVIAELLGVPRSDHDRFRAWSEELATLVFASGLEDRHQRGRAALTALAGYLGEQLERRVSQPAGDLLTTLASGGLSQADAVANAVLLLFAGHETTTTLLSNGLAVLLAHPLELERLTDDRRLLPTAVDELLRYEGPSKLMPRWATSKLQLRGKTIAAGELVYLVQAAANRDPEAFEEPDRLDVGRRPNPHLGFGYGLHYCLGGPLARLETELALNRILDRHPQLHGTLPAWRATLLGRSVEPFTIQLTSA